MRFWKSPIGVTLLFTAVVFLGQFTNFAESLRVIGVFALIAIATFFIHELGHVVFGVVAGYQFHFLTAGPIMIERKRITVNPSWAYFGGVASCSPKTDDLQKIGRQHFWFAAGGPMVSLLFGIVSLIAGALLEIQAFTLFAFMNFAIFVVTMIPFKGGFKSDGLIMIELMRNDREKEQFVSSLLLMKEMMSPAVPTEWSRQMIEHARTLPANENNMSNSYLLFYYDLCDSGFEVASNGVASYKALPVTKKNKMTMQFATHLKQLDAVMNGHATPKQLRELHSMMMSVEPISYKRSEWMIAKLEGNETLAKKKLTEHRGDIKQGKKQFGFYVAEEKLTDLIEQNL